MKFLFFYLINNFVKRLNMNLNEYDDNITELDLFNRNLNIIPNLSRFKNLELLYLHDNNISDITSLQCLTKLKYLYLSIKPFIVKEINPQLLINQQLDNEMIEQVYVNYTKDEIKDYKIKVKEKFKNYKFIMWE